MQQEEQEDAVLKTFDSILPQLQQKRPQTIPQKYYTDEVFDSRGNIPNQILIIY